MEKDKIHFLTKDKGFEITLNQLKIQVPLEDLFCYDKMDCLSKKYPFYDYFFSFIHFDGSKNDEDYEDDAFTESVWLCEFFMYEKNGEKNVLHQIEFNNAFCISAYGIAYSESGKLVIDSFH